MNGLVADVARGGEVRPASPAVHGMRAVWKALDAEGDVIAAVCRLRLLTAQRGGEVLGGAWSEIDLTSRWWTIPAARSKNGLAHRIPLSPQAVIPRVCGAVS